MLALEGDDAGRFVLDEQRPHEGLVALDGRVKGDRIGCELLDQAGAGRVADGFEPAVVHQASEMRSRLNRASSSSRGAVEQRVFVVEHGHGSTDLDEPAELVGGLAFTFERERGALEHFLLRFGEVEFGARRPR